MNIGANEGASDDFCFLFPVFFSQISIIYPYMHMVDGGRVGRPGVKKSLSGNIIGGFQETTLQAII